MAQCPLMTLFSVDNSLCNKFRDGVVSASDRHLGLGFLISNRHYVNFVRPKAPLAINL